MSIQVSLPFGFSPAASQKLAHPDGEVATSRAAAKFGICMGLSSYSNYSLEDVGAQGLGNPYVIQMCVLRDRSITLQLLKRAESTSSLHCAVSCLTFPESGYKALFLSVDVPVLGMRLNEMRNNFFLPEDMEWPNILSNGSDDSDKTNYGTSTHLLEKAILTVRRSKSRLGTDNSLDSREHINADLAQRGYITSVHVDEVDINIQQYAPPPTSNSQSTTVSTASSSPTTVGASSTVSLQRWTRSDCARMSPEAVSPWQSTVEFAAAPISSRR